MTKCDPGGRKRRLKLINEARRRRKDDDDVGGVSRLETTTTTTTTTTDFGGATLATKEKDHPKQRDFGGDAMAFGVVAKYAMKKATKKAKFLESACASRALLFSFPKREMEERLDVWVPLFQLWLCSFRLFQLCESTHDTSLPCSLFAQNVVVRARIRRDTSDARIKPRLSSVHLEKTTIEQIEAEEAQEHPIWLGGFRQGSQRVVVGDDGVDTSEEYEVEEDVEDAVERVRRE